MSDTYEEVGFATPLSALAQYYEKYLVLMLVAVLLGGFATKFNLLIMLIAMASILVILGIGYRLTISKKLIYVSQRGIRGTDPFGLEVRLDWSELILVKGTAYSSLPGLIISDSRLKALSFPVAVAMLPDFLKAMRRFAPSNNALLQEIEKLHAESPAAR